MRLCSHDVLEVETSSHAVETGYNRPPEGKRRAAATPSGRVQPKHSKTNGDDGTISYAQTFPGPLILPGDDLAQDPGYPPQSFLAWKREKDRNEVTDERRTVYVGGPPAIGLDFMRSWSQPAARNLGALDDMTVHPAQKDIFEYLEAFYSGMAVKPLQTEFQFGPWDENQTTRRPEFIALNSGSNSVRIRTRSCPDGMFERQINLNDILDACIDSLPKDAYAFLLVVEQDLYEDDDDDFCCGRAYGGSRVAVVQTARYNPALDESSAVERDHAWPTSHCGNFIQQHCKTSSGSRYQMKWKRKTSQSSQRLSPLRAAVTAHASLPSLCISPTPGHLTGLWLGRICRTASHELGHCLGIDHCVYYACAMQGTASMSEDARQPPYLCPVDLTKLLKASGAEE